MTSTCSIPSTVRPACREPRTRRPLKSLDEPYRARAIPAGSARYFSWLFAASSAREPLLGIYALLAEWRALMDPGTEADVARVKLAWWQEEVHRMRRAAPNHPIGQFLTSLPGAGGVDFAPLSAALDAACAYVVGAPLERARDLDSYAHALQGAPLLLASRFAGGTVDAAAVDASVTALAAGEYLARAVQDYRREARHGRVCFAVDELLDAGIEDADLAADVPSPRLRQYLERLTERADARFDSASRLLVAPHLARERHLAVLSTLQRRQLRAGAARGGPLPLMKDLYAAWTTARRAAASR